MGEVIKRQKGSKFIGWYIRYYDIDGKRKIKASKQPTYSDARRMLLQLEAEIARGEAGLADPRTKLTVAENCAQFLDAAHPQANSEIGYRRSASSGLNRILPFVGALHLDKLRRRDIELARDNLSQRYKPNTVRAALCSLGAALTWAVQQDFIAQSPMSKIIRPRLEYSSERLTTEEASALLAEGKRQAAKSVRAHSLYIGVSLGLRLGLRRGEVFGLRWENVALKAKHLTIARSFDALPKNGKTRTLLISSSLLEDLKRWQSVCPKSIKVVPIGTTCRTGIAALLNASHCNRLRVGGMDCVTPSHQSSSSRAGAFWRSRTCLATHRSR